MRGSNTRNICYRALLDAYEQRVCEFMLVGLGRRFRLAAWKFISSSRMCSVPCSQNSLESTLPCRRIASEGAVIMCECRNAARACSLLRLRGE